MKTLEKLDVQALRKATGVCFSRGRIVASLEQRTNSVDPFNEGKTDRSRTIEVETNLAPDSLSFASILYCQSSMVWKTIASLIRAGDALRIVFNADHFSNSYARKAAGTTQDGVSFDGLHADALFLDIVREGRTGKVKTMSFLLDVSVCPDNSARMVRPSAEAA